MKTVYELTFSDGIKLVPLPALTVKNSVSLSAIADKIKAVTEVSADANRALTLATLVSQYPAINEYYNADLTLNKTRLQRYVDGMRSAHEGEEPFDEVAANKRAVEILSKEWQQYLKSNAHIMQALYYTASIYPLTMQALKMGLEFIKILNPELDMDNCEATNIEVSAYLTGFCAMLGE